MVSSASLSRSDRFELKSLSPLKDPRGKRPAPAPPGNVFQGAREGFYGESPAPPGKVFVGVIGPGPVPIRRCPRPRHRLSSDTLPGGAGVPGAQARGGGFSCVGNYMLAFKRQHIVARLARYSPTDSRGVDVMQLRGPCATPIIWGRANERLKTSPINGKINAPPGPMG